MRDTLLVILLALVLGGTLWLVSGPPAGDRNASGSHSLAGSLEARPLVPEQEPDGSSWPSGSSSQVPGGARQPGAPAAASLTARSYLPGDGGLSEASAERTLVADVGGQPPREPTLFAGRVLELGSPRPVVGAHLTFRAGERKSVAESDDHGRFELDWIEGLPGDLTIEHEQFVDFKRAGLDPAEEGANPSFELARSGTLAGHVSAPLGTDMGAVRVELWRKTVKSERSWPRLEASLDEHGDFRIADLEPGEYALCPRAEGLSGRYTAGVMVRGGSEAYVELACAEGGSLVGQLVAARGSTIESFAGSVVELRPRDVGLPKSLARERTLTAALESDGHFELLGIPPGAHKLRIELPWGALLSESLDLDKSGQRIEREFEVPGPARLEGLVVDARGKPQGGVPVLVGRKQGGGPLAKSLLGGDAEPGGGAETVTDTKGRFVLDPVAASEQLVVVARPDGGAPAWLALAALAPGEQRTGVRLELVEGLALSGRIEVATFTGVGEHLAGASVLARYHSGGREFTFTQSESDAEGRYTLAGLMPGSLRVEVRKTGYRTASKTIELFEGVAPAPLDLALERTLRLAGRVVDETGRGIPGLHVRISDRDPDLPKQPDEQAKLSHCDDFGRFSFKGLLPGDWYLSPKGAEYELVECIPRRVTAAFMEDAGEVELVVRRRAKTELASLQLVALSGATGLEPVGLEVHGIKAAAAVIDGGEVKLTGLAPEPLRLTLSAEGCAAERLDVALFPGAALDLGVVTLQPGARVTVTVKGPGGQALKQAKVKLQPRPHSRGGPEGGASTLGLEHIGQGRYRVEGVAFGSWNLKVSQDGMLKLREVLEVDRESLHKGVSMQKAPAGKGR